MKILCIYPHFDIEVYSISYAVTHLSRIGVKLVVITSKMHTSKGSGKSKEFEVIEGIPIYRIYEDTKEQFSYPVKKYNKVFKITKEFKPNLIFCSQQGNMPIANELKKDFNIPIVLFIEFAKNPFLLLGRRKYYLGIKTLAPLSANLYWRWLSKHTSAIITSNIGDKPYLNELSKYGIPAYYIPWCNQLPVEYSELKRNKNKGIYVGLLSDSKNSEEFVKAIPLLLENTPTEKFIFVGGGPGLHIIIQLQKSYGQRIKHFVSLPRKDALQLISSCYYSFTPVVYGGWGFIGDSWAVETPLVVTHNKYGFNNRTDALIVNDVNIIHLLVNELYLNSELYRKLQENGFERYSREHSAKSVGDKLLKIFELVLKNG